MADFFYSPYNTWGFRLYLGLLGVKGKHSYAYVYNVDENAGTYELETSVEAPFSSIVSSAQLYEGHYIILSGMAKAFGEYDEGGELIREYSFRTMIQCYRVKKSRFLNFWFEA